MPAVAVAVLPLLTVTSRMAGVSVRWLRGADPLIERFPEQHLSIAFATLPNNAREWPYGAAQLVSKLEAIETLRQDLRLNELRRRLAAS